MKKGNSILRTMTLAVTFILCSVAPSLALTQAELSEQGKLLTELLVAGRGVVAESIVEYKINDATIGDKGFTPDVFVQKINAAYQKSTGIDIVKKSSPKKLPGNTMELLGTMLEVSKQTVAENQALINTKGIAFKGFIPASYGRIVADKFKARTGIALKQTSTRYRNTYNAPDAFEKANLARMEAPGYPKDQIIEKVDGNALRIMRPLYVKKACLSCHGDPKGQLDVAGRKKEGYREGDLRGAISISLSMK